MIGVLLTALVAAVWRTTRGASGHERPSASGRWSARVGFPPALDVGFRLAVEPGRGRRAVPVRSALIGAIVGVLGVVGCLTFRSGLDAAVASPARSGVVWNYVVASGEGLVAPKDAATIVGDHDVAAALEATWARAVPVNGVATPTFGTKALKADHESRRVVRGGRRPGSDEIAFAPTTMKALHLHVGDVVTVGRTAGVRVVGEALLPATSHTDYDQSGWMTVGRAHGGAAAAFATESGRHRGLRRHPVASRRRRRRRLAAHESRSAARGRTTSSRRCDQRRSSISASCVRCRSRWASSSGCSRRQRSRTRW